MRAFEFGDREGRLVRTRGDDWPFRGADDEAARGGIVL